MPPPPKIDPAILTLLSPHLDTSSAEITTHGGSGFSSTYRLTTPTKSLFIKQSSSPGAAIMFEGEHESLNAIHSVVPSLCPESLGWGKLVSGSGGGGYFLVTEFLDLGGGSGSGSGSGRGSGMSLAEKLAKLHSTPAPAPAPAPVADGGCDDSKEAMFGFYVTTCCGDTPQPNGFEKSWGEFFGKKRLLAVLERGEKRNGMDKELRRVVETIVEGVVPRLLGDGRLGGKDGVKPVVVHGDLWSGNKGRGVFVGRGTGEDGGRKQEVEDVVFDPSVTYAHFEYDHGIMNMFGGFASGFWNEYWKFIDKTEPVEEYEDRVALYESYHHLNHYAIFGGGYKSGALALLKR